MEQTLDPRIQPMHDVGCSCCETSGSDVCVTGATLRLRAGVALAKMNRGEDRGYNTHLFASYEARYFLHTFNGR